MAEDAGVPPWARAEGSAVSLQRYLAPLVLDLTLSDQPRPRPEIIFLDGPPPPAHPHEARVRALYVSLDDDVHRQGLELARAVGVRLQQAWSDERNRARAAEQREAAMRQRRLRTIQRLAKTRQIMLGAAGAVVQVGASLHGLRHQMQAFQEACEISSDDQLDTVNRAAPMLGWM